MILLQQYLELKIVHEGQLRKFDVVEIFSDEDGISFKILYEGAYIFTIIPTYTGLLSFALSPADMELDIAIDWDLFSKTKAALYSIYLKEVHS